MTELGSATFDNSAKQTLASKKMRSMRAHTRTNACTHMAYKHSVSPFAYIPLCQLVSVLQPKHPLPFALLIFLISGMLMIISIRLAE